jgi:hypothetical protein
MSYVVVAPLIGVNGADGKLKMLYAGAPVPVDVSPADVERLAEGGLIENTAPVKVAAKKPAGASSDGTA